MNPARARSRSARRRCSTHGADLLERPAATPRRCDEALAATPRERARARDDGARRERDGLPGDVERDRDSALDPSFRAQELSFVVSQVAAQRRRSPRRPSGAAGSSGCSAASPRASPAPWRRPRSGPAAHVERHSVWLHNSVRGAAGLGLAVLVADLTGVQHSFWVVLGALSVLRSNALEHRPERRPRRSLGTVAGFVVGGAAAGRRSAPTRPCCGCCCRSPILVAGLAPAAISFAAGQAAFTLRPGDPVQHPRAGRWRVGLVRIEDVRSAARSAWSSALLFWPRGAVAALGRALADAYRDSAAYLARRSSSAWSAATRRHAAGAAERADAAAAASRRLDDAFRAYLAERGAEARAAVRGDDPGHRGGRACGSPPTRSSTCGRTPRPAPADEPAMTELLAIAATRATGTRCSRRA